MTRATIGLIGLLMLASCAGAPQSDGDAAPGSKVEIVSQPDGSFALLRNGEPYVVRGAGYGNGDLALVAASGGNSIRTWGIEQLEDIVDGKRLIDRAHELGITVVAGIWVQHPRHGFDYNDPASIQRQREHIRDAVWKYKDHPALLAWGLGNEMEAFGQAEKSPGIWRELNRLAQSIKAIDPHHPVMTVVAGAAPETLASIRADYPNLDILGVNAYGDAANVGRRLPDDGWPGPYMLTEFGVIGTWESPSTAWGAPIESDPSTKAALTYTAYTLDRDDNAGRSLGSYVFVWGNKQEATASWYGMFLESGEKLPRVDAMAYAWTGEWPESRAPRLLSLETPVALEAVAPGTPTYAVADIIDRERDTLTYQWDIRAESSDRRVGGDAEAAPPSFPDAIEKGQGTPRIEFRTPNRPGGYRVFVTAYDGQGAAVVHNLPFYVDETLPR